VVTERRIALRDPEVIRALAHPLRIRLLHHLLTTGPNTATQCATATGSTPSNCSWHLRQLAAHGLVEPVDGADGRQRPWQAAAVGFDLDPDPDPAVRTAQDALLAAELAEDVRRTREYLRDRAALPDDWQAASALNTYGLHLTPAELARLTAAVDDLLRPYRTATRPDTPPDARPVTVALHAFPTPLS
jgi:DNA-binding transcriptional ArsR family regulator